MTLVELAGFPVTAAGIQPPSTLPPSEGLATGLGRPDHPPVSNSGAHTVRDRMAV